MPGVAFNGSVMLFQDHEAVGRVPVLMPCRWEMVGPCWGTKIGKVPPVMKVPVQGYDEKTELRSATTSTKLPSWD